MGLDSNLFVAQPVNENLICNLCWDVLDKPMSACAQGHTFCSSCLTKVVEKAICPTCRGPRIESVFRPLQNILGALQMRCRHHQALPMAEDGRDDDNPSSRKKTKRTATSLVASSSSAAPAAEASPSHLSASAAAEESDESKTPLTTGCPWIGPLEEFEKHLNSTCE